jgi:hypothetical protein
MPIFVEDECEGDGVVELARLDPREAERVREDLERHRRDALWFDAQRDAILAAYPDQWVAVFNQQVVAAAKSLGTLLAQLDARGIPRGCAFCEYVTGDEVDLILVCS